MARQNEEYLEKPLPSNEEAEVICLGAVILDNRCMDTNLKFFVPDDCYNTFHRSVYGAMIELHQEGKVIDPITIGEVLKRKGILETLGGITRITNLTMGLPHFNTTEEYAKIVRRMAIIRATVRLCISLTRDLLSDDPEEFDTLARAEQKIIQLNSSLISEGDKVPDGFIPAQDITQTLRDSFEQLHMGIATGTPTGMQEIDDDLDGGGLQRKGSYLIAGSEKSGKTSLALDWIGHISGIEKKTSLIVTLEMSKEILLKRMYSAHMGIPYFMFRPGFRDTEHNKVYSRAIEGLHDFGKLPIKLADNIFEWKAIKRHCTIEVEKGHKNPDNEVAVIVLDYLQLINVSGIYDDRARVEHVSRGIKRLASELDVPIIVMSSLNRKKLGDDPNPEPDVDNLRESGQLGYDAEGIFLLHNPARVPGKPYVPRDVTDMTLILARQRNGPSGRYNLKFIGKYMQFMTESNYAKEFGVTDTEQSYAGTVQEVKLKDERILNLWDEDDDEWQNS